MTHTSLLAHWLIDKSSLSLGNLLTFRQELELLARVRKFTQVSLVLTSSTFWLPAYFQEALSSCLEFQVIWSKTIPQSYDWPPSDKEVGAWSYSSLRRVTLLSQILGVFPRLTWPKKIEQEAEEIYHKLKREKQGPLISVHLKNQPGGPEESNATPGAWHSFFVQHPDSTFVVLGGDVLSDNIFTLPNVISAHHNCWGLAAQLAFCACADAFMGMASGICSGALFSLTPYVVFKHPQHHPEEMKIEMGTQDHFPFSLPSQKLWREPDTLENLNRAYCLLRDCMHKKEGANVCVF